MPRSTSGSSMACIPVPSMSQTPACTNPLEIKCCNHTKCNAVSASIIERLQWLAVCDELNMDIVDCFFISLA